MKEWSILIKVQADTKEDACEAAAMFLNTGSEPDEIQEGNDWNLARIRSTSSNRI